MLARINDEQALEMLLERLERWTDDYTTHKLYEQMYESYIDGGCFEGCDFDVMVIVDNDYINYCDVISEGDDGYENIKELYERDGIGDISCDDELNNGYSYIEAEYNGSFLLRW